MGKRTTLEGIDQATSLPEDTRLRSTRLTTYFWALIVIWTIIVISLLVLDFLQIGRVQHEMAKTEARANFNKDQAFRFWASKHGGVYVPINSRTPQNPFLSHVPERDITTESGKALTLMNPAYMLRQMMEEYEDLFGVRGHITSLQHFRPETAPDEWERSALIAFERGDKEVIVFTKIEGKPYLRLMRPMIAKKSCLKCHAEQGYKVGDVRGGVSISVPMTPYVTNQRKVFTIHALALGLLWLLGIAGIRMATRGLRNRIKERDRAEAELQEAHDRLEMRIEERTADLKREIEEHKQAEEALREGEAQKAAILDGITTNLAFVNENLEILWANKASADSVNRNVDEMIGHKCHEFWADPNVPCDDCPTVKAFKTKRPEQTIMHSPDGRVWDEKGKPVFDGKGGLIGVLEIARDITARARAEEALRESDEKYRLLIENATDAIYIAQDEVLKFANPKAEEMIGYSAEELAEIPFLNLIHPEDRDMVLERHLKRLKGEEIPSVYSFRILDRSGEELSVELNAVLINWEGRPATLNFLRDITAQKRLEAQLQQAQKMEAIGTLAGGIAHDFNNLLMAIQSRTSIMLMNKDSSHPDFKHLTRIEGHVESAADLTMQLLGFARGGKYEVRPTDINEVIKKQNRMFGRTKKEITIRGKYEKVLWSVEVDRGQIEQVLLNLYVNAWQAMPGGGDLYLETENVTLDENYVKPFSIEPGRYVKISVTDTGVGMDKATQERIFEPFFTTKEMGRGTGLGLASVYGIIKNHGGFINVYSEKGEGATFNIYLPATGAEGMAQRAERKGKDKIIRGKETILFVDDEDMIIETAEELLEQLGYKVLTARSGREAIEIYEENKERIDIVILDMVMPDMSGGETYDKLKEINPEIKVLLASGYSLNGAAAEILDRGCNGFIQKPVKMGALSQKLREILDEK